MMMMMMAPPKYLRQENEKVEFVNADKIRAHLAAKGMIVNSNNANANRDSANANGSMGQNHHEDPIVNDHYERYHALSRKLNQRDFKDLRPERERSPSPEPVYDKVTGFKINSRELRIKDKIRKERNLVIEFLLKNDSENFQAPMDYKQEKKKRKIFVPEKEFPGYNFVGLIIGPRGNTQKRMQRETNTRIVLRGKGCIKGNASRDGRTDYKEDEPLHVVIEGERDEDVDLAAEMVSKLLTPIDEGFNHHKRAQLKELAMINGTFQDRPEHCLICGGFGHSGVQCPERDGNGLQTFKADVLCKICGDGGHPTNDCPMKGKPGFTENNNNNNNSTAAGERNDEQVPKELTKEYMNFLSEIGVDDKSNVIRNDNNNNNNNFSHHKQQQQQQQQQLGAGGGGKVLTSGLPPPPLKMVTSGLPPPPSSSSSGVLPPPPNRFGAQSPSLLLGSNHGFPPTPSMMMHHQQFGMPAGIPPHPMGMPMSQGMMHGMLPPPPNMMMMNAPPPPQKFGNFPGPPPLDGTEPQIILPQIAQQQQHAFIPPPPPPMPDDEDDFNAEEGELPPPPPSAF